MKLKYSFTKVDMGDEIISVPVGDNADDFHAVLKLNEEGQFILELLEDEISEEEIADRIVSDYRIERGKAAMYVSKFINQLRQIGVLEES